VSVELATRVLAADRDAVVEAARLLASGGLVAFPTETVYGLGADATSGEAVARLYAAKGRPSFNPLISHVADVSAARALGVFNRVAEQLAAAFWPGPLTLVVPRAPDCPVAELATAGLDTIALRVPAHTVAREVLRAVARPIVAPSANRSGHVSTTTAAHVAADLSGRIDLILDGGTTVLGLESTIVACLGDTPALLRPGGLVREEIEVELGAKLAMPRSDAHAPRSPGQLVSHYAPRARLRLDAETATEGEALLAFGPAGIIADRAAATLNLSSSGDLIEAAANLFSHLRALDQSGAVTIAVMPIPHEGLGEALNDRLRRAAAPRP
jgi:L-threonylcarbamoyladenylate synthase